MTHAYRENDISARVTDVEDRIHNLEGLAAKDGRRMDENTKEARVAAIIGASIVTVLVVLIGSGLYACIDGHRSDVDVAKATHACPSSSPMNGVLFK